MFEFNERFMEDCLCEAPEAFLGETLKVVERQPRLNGFIPDVILQSTGGSLMLVELQQRALDRPHLYRTLEYRDLWNETNNPPIGSTILVCNEIEERYAKLCKTHSVKVVAIPRDQWIDIALAACPNAIRKTLKERSAPSVTSNERKNAIGPNQIQPLPFEKHESAEVYWRHLHTELSRLGLSAETLSRGRYQYLISDIDHFMRRGLKGALQDLDPTGWNIDKLLEKPKMWQHPVVETIARIRKPRITLSTHVTAKGNLSLNWRPRVDGYSTSNLPQYDVGDWARWCGTSTYGWQRPPNELLFLHDFEDMGPWRDQIDDSLNWYVLDELILTITRKIHEALVANLSAIVEVEQETDFELLLEDGISSDNEWHQSLRVVGWNIFYVQERAVELERSELAQFLQRHSQDAASLIAKYHSASHKKGRRDGKTKVEHFRMDLKDQGIELSKRRLDELLVRLQRFYPELWNIGRSS